MDEDIGDWSPCYDVALKNGWDLAEAEICQDGELGCVGCPYGQEKNNSCSKT